MQAGPGIGGRGTTLRVSSLSQPSSHTLQVPSSMPMEKSPDPLERFWNEQGPWAPQGIADIPTQPDVLPRHSRPLNLRTRYNQPDGSFRQYRTTPISELESNTTGAYPSDSGYGTRSQATRSIFSSDPADRNQDCPSISGHMDNLGIFAADAPHPYPRLDNHQQLEHQPDTEHGHGASLQCHYDGCGTFVKCQSDLKYVATLRHLWR